MGPEKFPDDSFYPVPSDCSFEPAMNTDPKSVARLSRGSVNKTEVISLYSPAIFIDAVVVLWIPE
jgi:hypothetical protein